MLWSHGYKDHAWVSLCIHGVNGLVRSNVYILVVMVASASGLVWTVFATLFLCLNGGTRAIRKLVYSKNRALEKAVQSRWSGAHSRGNNRGLEYV